MRAKIKTVLPLGAALLMAHLPLWHTGFAAGHDWIFEFAKTAEYARSLAQGVFPVRWAWNYGPHGSPVFIFMPPLFLTLSGSLILLGLPLAAAVKLSLAVLAFFGAVGAFLLARRLFDEDSAVFAACVFALSPYAFVNVYMRNAFSEFTAQCLAPWVLYGIERVLNDPPDRRGGKAALTAAAALFALSHNLSQWMYLPVFAVFIIVRSGGGDRGARLRRLAAPLVIAAGLSCFYWLPAIVESAYLNTQAFVTGKFDAGENLIPLPAAVMGSWVSWTPTAAALLFFSVIAARKGADRLTRAQNALVRSCLALLCVYFFLTTPASRFFWEAVRPARFIQFPWRLYSPAGLLMALLAGAGFYAAVPRIARSLSDRAVLSVLAFLLCLTPALYAWDGRFTRVSEAEFRPDILRARLSVETASFLYSPKDAAAPNRTAGAAPVFMPDTSGTLTDLQPKQNGLAFTAECGMPSYAVIDQYYFPGWRAAIDGKTIEMDRSPDGTLRLKLSAGRHRVSIYLDRSPVRRTGEIVSLLALAACGAALTFAKRRI